MLLVGITLFLILVGLGFFAYGAFALSKYAFRLGTGTGLLTLLFPPYTFYFAVFKLEEDGKSAPTASWAFGLVVSLLLVLSFWPDLSALMRGDMDRFKEKPAATSFEEEQPADEAAAEKTAQVANQENPTDEAKPADGATAVEANPTDEVKPADGATAADGTKPADDAQPVDGAAPANAGTPPAATGDNPAPAQ